MRKSSLKKSKTPDKSRYFQSYPKNRQIEFQRMSSKSLEKKKGTGKEQLFGFIEELDVVEKSLNQEKNQEQNFFVAVKKFSVIITQTKKKFSIKFQANLEDSLKAIENKLSKLKEKQAKEKQNHFASYKNELLKSLYNLRKSLFKKYDPINHLVPDYYQDKKYPIFKYDVCEGKKPSVKKQNLIQLEDDVLKSISFEQLRPNFIKQLKFSEELNQEIKAMIQVKDVEEYPHCCIGIVTGILDKQNYYGTGCLIAPRIVLTCAHNAYDRTSTKEGASLCFTPVISGKEGGKKIPVKKAYYPKDYELKQKEQEALSYDFSVLELKNDLQEQYGYLGIDTSKENVKGVQEVELFGYPNKKALWHGEGTCKKVNDFFLFHRIPTHAGQSGSPVIKNKKYIIGIHIGKYIKEDINTAVRLTNEKRQMINGWVGEITGELDLELLELGDDEMESLADKWSERLALLNLKKNSITSKGLIFLSKGKWDKLKNLNLSHNKIDDKGVKFLLKFPALQVLDLSDNSIKGEGLEVFSTDKFPYIEDLDLSYNPIGDESITFLKIPTLKYLTIQSSKLTGKAPQILFQMEFPELKRLDIRENDLGKDIKKKIQRIKEKGTDVKVSFTD